MTAAADTPLRVLIVDDHMVVRAGLRALLTGEPGFDVVGETGDGEEAVRLAARLGPDVVLMDLRLTGDTAPDRPVNGLDANRRITAGSPPQPGRRPHRLRHPGRRRPGHGGRSPRLRPQGRPARGTVPQAEIPAAGGIPEELESLKDREWPRLRRCW